MECDFRAIASAPFNASNTIKDSSLNDVGLDGHASGCPGARELLFASGHFASPATAATVTAAAAARCGSHSGHFGRRQEIKESDLKINGVV